MPSTTRPTTEILRSRWRGALPMITYRPEAVAAGRVVAAGYADRAIAVGQPGLVGLGIAPGGEAVAESHLRCIAVEIGQAGERRGGADRHGEFRRYVGFCASQRLGLGLVLGRIAPLHHVVVLRADDGQAVEILLLRQGLDVGRVRGRETWRQFDHDPAAGHLQVKRVGRVQGTPVAGLRGGEDIGQRLRVRRRWFIRRLAEQGDSGQGQPSAPSFSRFIVVSPIDLIAILAQAPAAGVSPVFPVPPRWRRRFSLR